jgi:hypothetical protein
VRDVVTGPVQRVTNNILVAFGKKAVYVRDKNGQELFFNGTYLGSETQNSIYINLDSNISVLRVASHEALHAMRRQAPDVYKTLNAALTKLVNNGAGAKHLVSRGYIQNEAEFDSTNINSRLREELNADVFGDVLSDPKALNDLINGMKPTAAKQFLHQARTLLDKIIGKLKGDKTLGASAYADLVNAREYVVAAAKEYARRADAGGVPVTQIQQTLTGSNSLRNAMTHPRLMGK